uniref:Uncharacterized protein n=1 Tax=Arundo donax TaxID=35708 RepID=A0A0A9EDT8_ARUDO
MRTAQNSSGRTFGKYGTQPRPIDLKIKIREPTTI